ncbi:nucleocapsid [Hymenopteran rhabdo-related virus 23]|uniref:Nucleoprotein n=1 Tax=Hymenopteran rhabdo-related virus 23 TaxID=2847804 RepID=A0AAE9GZN9_9RHAB|nr:nucleocapsid [Hymenopteran rhabdo-related virus]UOS86044.1 nucleocapsid [Hymenopteran rhabdo-related virus 23]
MATSKVLTRMNDMEDVTFTKSGIEKEWDESVFEKKFSTLPTKYSGEDLAGQVMTAKIFLNWYVGGKMDEDFNLPYLMIKMLGLLNHKGTSILTEVYNNTLLETHPIGQPERLQKLKLETDIAANSYFSTMGNAIIGVSAGGVVPGQGSFEPQSESREESTTMSTVTTFYNACWSILDGETSSSDKKVSPKLLDLLNYLSYLSCILSRYSVKSQASVTGYFARAATKNFNNIISTNYSWITPPPHASSVTALQQSFTKGSEGFSSYLITELKMFKLLRHRSYDELESLLTAGNLLHLKFNGMLLINVASKICLAAHLTMKGLLDISAYEVFEASILRLIEVSNKYLSQKAAASQITFPWCRLIDDKYMTSLAADPNRPLLELWLTAVALIDNNPDVWVMFPWNGTAPVNKAYTTWAENLSRTLEPTDLKPITTKAKDYLESKGSFHAEEENTRSSIDEYQQEL